MRSRLLFLLRLLYHLPAAMVAMLALVAAGAV